MNIVFKHLGSNEWLPDSAKNTAFLENDNWDDFSFKTLFRLTVFDEHGEKINIGDIKIGYVGQIKKMRTHDKIPKIFESLDNNFFSLGQGVEYYQNIHNLSATTREKILGGLNDVVYSEAALAIAEDEDVFNVSLLRSVAISSIKGQLKRILAGEVLLTDFHFKYRLKGNSKTAGIDIHFDVEPNANPPSNIHVLIGRNGVGKTFILDSMVRALVDGGTAGERGEFYDMTTPFPVIANAQDIFSSLILVSFSAFDPFEPLVEEEDKRKSIRHFYVGLKLSKSQLRHDQKGGLKDRSGLTEDFANSIGICFDRKRSSLWAEAIYILESDPNFGEVCLSDLLNINQRGKLIESAKSIFEKLSSGHAIVLLTVTKLVETIEEKTLILIDEPESHLHPPLLASFVRCLSNLLIRRNGVAIVATHSPVVLQEVPAKCVWKIRRSGLEAVSERPEIETFGENVGILTREIFGLEVTNSGFHILLREAVEKGLSFDQAVRHFDGELGLEAKAILRGLIAERNSKGG